MLDTQGHVVIDAFTRTEDLYPSLRRALIKFEALVPNTVNWTALDEAESRKLKHMSRDRVRKRHNITYSCFYDAALRRLVESHDHEFMQTFNYAFEDLPPCSRTWGAAVRFNDWNGEVHIRSKHIDHKKKCRKRKRPWCRSYVYARFPGTLVYRYIGLSLSMHRKKVLHIIVCSIPYNGP